MQSKSSKLYAIQEALQVYSRAEQCRAEQAIVEEKTDSTIAGHSAWLHSRFTQKQC